MQNLDQDFHIARKNLQLAHKKLARISPVRSLASIDQGDVLVSQSGNLRLVLEVQRHLDDPVIFFLSKLSNGQVKLENALLKKIDLERISSVVIRRNGNPLRKMDKYLINLQTDPALLRNTQILLQDTNLGMQLSQKLELQNQQQDNTMLTFHLRERDAQILAIGARSPKQGERRFGLRFNFSSNPSEEYIKEANFYAHTPIKVKDLLVTSCILANTIENVVNLERSTQLVKEALGPTEALAV